MVWQPPDGAAPAAQWSGHWTPPGATTDGEDGPDTDLLRKLAIERPNHVWCADVTYIPMRRGFLYLVAIMDWATRKVLAWRLSNTMDAGFCVAALEEALTRFGKPEIFNTDQGSQFTSQAFTSMLRDAEVRISMDGRGRWITYYNTQRPHSGWPGEPGRGLSADRTIRSWGA